MVEPIADGVTRKDHLASQIVLANRADAQVAPVAILAMEPTHGRGSRDQSSQPPSRLRAAVPSGIRASAHLTDLGSIDTLDTYATPIEPQKLSPSLADAEPRNSPVTGRSGTGSCAAT